MAIIRGPHYPVGILKCSQLSANAKLIWLYLHLVPDIITINCLTKSLNLTESELKNYLEELHSNKLCEEVEII